MYIKVQMMMKLPISQKFTSPKSCTSYIDSIYTEDTKDTECVSKSSIISNTNSHIYITPIYSVAKLLFSEKFKSI